MFYIKLKKMENNDKPVENFSTAIQTNRDSFQFKLKVFSFTNIDTVAVARNIN